MFGFLLGTARKDLEVAKLINLHFESYHRIFTSMGIESLVGTIQRNPMVNNFKEGSENWSFFIGEGLEDFHFYITTSTISPPALMAVGMLTYKGFSVYAPLTTGKKMVDCKATRLTKPTNQADILAKALCWKFNSIRVP